MDIVIVTVTETETATMTVIGTGTTTGIGVIGTMIDDGKSSSRKFAMKALLPAYQHDAMIPLLSGKVVNSFQRCILRRPKMIPTQNQKRRRKGDTQSLHRHVRMTLFITKLYSSISLQCDYSLKQDRSLGI
jgi:hypothetical protein